MVLKNINLLAAALLFSLCLSLGGCGGSSGVRELEAYPHQSQEELESGYYYYEGVFLSTEEAARIFHLVSGDFPRYSVVSIPFHVTTEYLPEITHDELYGTEVTVHITGYKYGTSTDPEDGSTSLNEGFAVDVYAEDPEMQALLDSIDKNWHITGSYTTAARYTKYMDFSDAEPVVYIITGVFGKCDSDGNLVPADTVLQ